MRTFFLEAILPTLIIAVIVITLVGFSHGAVKGSSAISTNTFSVKPNCELSGKWSYVFFTYKYGCELSIWMNK